MFLWEERGRRAKSLSQNNPLFGPEERSGGGGGLRGAAATSTGCDQFGHRILQTLVLFCLSASFLPT